MNDTIADANPTLANLFSLVLPLLLDAAHGTDPAIRPIVKCRIDGAVLECTCWHAHDAPPDGSMAATMFWNRWTVKADCPQMHVFTTPESSNVSKVLKGHIVHFLLDQFAGMPSVEELKYEHMAAVGFITHERLNEAAAPALGAV